MYMYLSANRMGLPLFHFDVDINTGGHLETGQGVDRLLCRCDDIDQSLMGSLLELFEIGRAHV